MNKNILLFFLCCLFSANTFAQGGLQIFDTQMNDITNSAFTAHGETGHLIKAYAFVKNNTANDELVMVKKAYLKKIKGSRDYFCWEYCNESPYLMVADAPHLIQSDSITDNFYGAYTPDSVGQLIVRYTFYILNNPNDSSYIDITYDAVLGIKEKTTNKNFQFSAPYPNPANEQVSFNYTIPNENAQIEIYDLLGSKIKTVNLSNNEGKITFSTANLNNGIYFYTLIIDNKPYFSKKLIIKH